jgi:hypothetical protein
MNIACESDIVDCKRRIYHNSNYQTYDMLDMSPYMCKISLNVMRTLRLDPIHFLVL